MEKKKKLSAAGCRTNFVEIAAFFHLKLMKEQLGAVSSELQIILLFPGENTRAFKIKTLTFS